ncbi:MAG: IPT/TIG domain-containing protein, partial [Acidobacteriaceae bacterium]|nr:IPT/TIG domain-containing protein [Acidobacteriaceae bacterium]
ADFQTGQAARAVIGQSSFSTRDPGITPAALALSNGRLHVADASRRVLTFDVTQIPAPRDAAAARSSGSCAVCGFTPIASVPQTVIPGIASATSFGKTVVIADPTGHRVLIWRDSSLPRANKGPDVVLGGRANVETTPLSPSTISEPISVAFDGKRLFVGDSALHRVLVWNSLPSYDNQPADAVLGQQSFTTANASDTPGPDTIDRPTALASDGTNLFVADGAGHRILVFSAADTPSPNNPVSNSASLAPGAIAPGTLITINGRSLSDETESAPDGSADALPTELAGTEVIVNGIALPLLSVSPTQVRAQFPYGIGEPSAVRLYVRTVHDDGTVTTTNATALKVIAATPGLFAFGGTEPRAGMILHTDAESGVAGAPVTSENPASPGEILIVWAAGLGAVDTADAAVPAAGVPYAGADAVVLNDVAAEVSGRSAQVISATLPHGSVGIYEVRIQLPTDIGAEPETSLLISQNGEFSNAVTIPVQRIVH